MRMPYMAGHGKRNMIGGGGTYRCFLDIIRRYRPSSPATEPAREELIDGVWAELKALPVDRRGFVALVRQYGHARRGGLAWCHLYRVKEALARRPRPNLVIAAEQMAVAGEVVRRNEGAFRELAKH